MEVYWLEQTEANVPTADDWLSPNEQALLNAMRFAQRRSDWRLGRWTAKNALALYFLYLKLPADSQVLASIEIRPASTGAPEAYFGNQPAAATISLSHRAGVAACAITMPGVELGCDLETVEPRSDAFVADYFTTAEQSFIAQASVADRPRVLAMLWSAKESALKALHEGLRLDTRSVSVSPDERYSIRTAGARCRCIMRAAGLYADGGNIATAWCGPWWPRRRRAHRFACTFPITFETLFRSVRRGGVSA